MDKKLLLMKEKIKLLNEANKAYYQEDREIMSNYEYDKVREVLDYAVTEIPREKIYMGIPNYGYDSILPYVQGVSRADSVSNVEAVDLAADVGAYIQYDEVSQAPYFIYYDEQGRQHRVWFEDARSIMAKLNLFSEYGFEGVGYWNVMRYFPQNWLLVSNLYDIAKLV